MGVENHPHGWRGSPPSCPRYCLCALPDLCPIFPLGKIKGPKLFTGGNPQRSTSADAAQRGGCSFHGAGKGHEDGPAQPSALLDTHTHTHTLELVPEAALNHVPPSRDFLLSRDAKCLRVHTLLLKLGQRLITLPVGLSVTGSHGCFLPLDLAVL